LKKSAFKIRIMSLNLARRSIHSVSWNIAANIAKIAVLFVRSILLARLLPVETFGVYALATSIVGLLGILPDFGLGDAFLHRTAATADEDEAAAVHFTLKGQLTLIWAVGMTTATLMFSSGEMRLALLVLTVSAAGLHLTGTPRLILMRRVEHRRLAIIEIINAIVTTILAVALAWRGETIIALLATDVATLAITAFGLYVWRPVWRPRLALSSSIVRYYIRFGSRGLAANLLAEAVDNVDDIWTGAFLGQMPLGYYSRAFTFATYPRRLLATPLYTVAGGTYAELKGNRLRLSQAFFRVNALLLRSGTLVGGLLILVAPEFIRIFLGDKWLPMLDAFRLMLVFALLDPLRMTISRLFVAVGRPELIVQSRLLQLGILLLGLFIWGQTLGIAGVALVVDVTLLVGLTMLFWMARSYVDYSLRRLFLVPFLALAIGLLLSAISQQFVELLLYTVNPVSDRMNAFSKSFSFVLGYVSILLAFEWRELLAMFKQIKSPAQGSLPARDSELNGIGF
jgi:PST family polysaccharide transporter